MQVLSYVFETLLTFSNPVKEHTFVLRCLPKPTETQTVIESQLFTDPRIVLSELRDGFGNRLVSGYCPEAHDRFDFYASGQVAVFGPSDQPSFAHPIFERSTALTRCEGDLKTFETEYAAAGAAKRLEATDPAELAKARREVCEELVHLIYGHFLYDPGTTDVATAAAKAFAAGQGVCQDYAQSIIAVGRELGIPMRYVCGLIPGEGETHAWAEAYDGRSWFGLDPTNDRLVDDSYLVFSIGRDSADVPVERGVFHGHAVQSQRIDAILGTTLDNALIQVRRWRQAEERAEERLQERERKMAQAQGAAKGDATPSAKAVVDAAASASPATPTEAAPTSTPKPKPKLRPKAPIRLQRRGDLSGTGSGSRTYLHPETPRTSQLQQAQQQQQVQQ